MSDTKGEAIVRELVQLTDGLLYISETDAPLEPFFWPDANPATPTPEIVAQQTGLKADDLKSQSITTFFKPVVTEEEWHNDEEKAEVKRFQDLQAFIKEHLEKAKVFRAGDAEKQVYLVGAVSDGYAGVKTRVVET